MLRLKNIPSKNNIKNAMTMELIYNLELLIENNNAESVPKQIEKHDKGIRTFCLNTNCYFILYQKTFFRNKEVVSINCKEGYNVCEVCFNISKKIKRFSDLVVMSDNKIKFK